MEHSATEVWHRRRILVEDTGRTEAAAVVAAAAAAAAGKVVGIHEMAAAELEVAVVEEQLDSCCPISNPMAEVNVDPAAMVVARVVSRC